MAPHQIVLPCREPSVGILPQRAQPGGTAGGGPFTHLDYHSAPDVQREVVMKARIPIEGGNCRADAHAAPAAA
jgi:hypothetical protein